MTDYHVFCPSYRRADIAISHKLFKPERFSFVIREEEEDLYRKHDRELILIPEGAVSNIAETRNWILDNTSVKHIVQVDDDLRAIQWILNREYVSLSPDHIDHIIMQNFQMIEDLGCKMWGLQLLNDPIAYNIQKPYSFKKPILGPFTGMIANPLRYDETMPLKEDYDLFMQHMNEYGMVLRCNYLCYDCDHLKLPGGCQTHRNEEEERRQQGLLQKKWGAKYIRYNEKNPNSYNMRIRI